jgi:putative FmdB family regulatory protein
MPIYAYRCSSCGLEQDVMQKMSDAPLTTCPQCKTETFGKQLTAPGFHLKGSGWYQTDFKGGTGTAKSESKSDSPPPCQGGTGSCACN